MAVQTQIQTRRGTAASWTSTNPTLAAGEIGFETDTGKFKIGNGSTAWAALAYSAGATAVTYLFNATSGQTTFSGADANGLTLAYTVGAEQVYLNGVLQVRGSDYTATNGTSIVLASGALTSDVLNVIAYSAMTITDTYTQAQADAKFYQLAFNGAAGKNAIINGAFDIWQRGTSIAAQQVSFNYTADRWGASCNSSGAATVSRQVTGDTTNLPFIQYCARYQRTAGNTATGIQYFNQPIETINSIPYAGKAVTVSFYARAGANFSASGNVLSATLISGTGTDQNYLGTWTGAATVATTNATLTTTWQRFQFTGTVGATATELTLPFTYTPTGTAGANDYFELTGVQLELGSIATPFARAGGTIAGELAACQRYYYRQTSLNNNYENFGLGMSNGTTTAAVIPINLPATMRTAPTSVDYSTLRLSDFASGNSVTSLTIDGNHNGRWSAVVNAGVASGLTAYRSYALQSNNSTSGYIGFSAEL